MSKIKTTNFRRILRLKDVERIPKDIVMDILALAGQTEIITKEFYKMKQKVPQDLIAMSLLAKDSSSALPIAARYGHRDAVRWLINAGVNIEEEQNSDGETLLQVSAWRGELNTLVILIEVGAIVNTHNKNGETPLHNVGGDELAEITKALVSAGANVNAQDRWGDTPLHKAASRSGMEWNGYAEQAQALVSAGANVNAQNRDLTPLHYAAANRRIEVAEVLISAGANVNSQNRDWTPLHYAAANGSLDIVRILVNAGANVNAHSSEGKTPLYLASSCGHPDDEYYHERSYVEDFLISVGGM
jgi:ankyrin repeat protein